MIKMTVSAGYAKMLLDFAVSKGADNQQLLEQSHIELADLEDADKRIPMARYIALMKFSIVLCNEPSLALHFGEFTDVNKASVVGLMCYSADTMGEALKLLNRYGYLVMELDLPSPGERFQLMHR